MRDPRRRSTFEGKAGGWTTRAMRLGPAAALAAACLAGSGPAAAQELPTERPPDERQFVETGMNSDYYQGDRATQNLIEQVERYHLTEDTFWKVYKEGHLDYAREGLLFVLRWLPNHPRALYLLELIGKQMGQPEMAIPYYERALQLFPQHPYTRAQYGAYLIRLGAREVGLQELRAAVAADSTLLPARAWLEQAQLRPPPPVGPTPKGADGATGKARSARPTKNR